MPSSPEERCYQVVAPSVVSEIIDGEAVIMDLRSGHYYSARGCGATIWGCIELGRGDRQIIEHVVAHYAVDATQAASAVAAFIASLLEHDLVRAAAPGHPTDPDEAPASREKFTAPTLEVYTDMQDLLLLDPIHDVDEAGWPTRGPTDGDATHGDPTHGNQAAD
jgi:hypothetical protein